MDVPPVYRKISHSDIFYIGYFYTYKLVIRQEETLGGVNAKGDDSPLEASACDAAHRRKIIKESTPERGRFFYRGVKGK